jgi:hypothetical protein
VFLLILQNEKDKKLLLEGATRLQRGATAAHEVARANISSSARIQEYEMKTMKRGLLEKELKVKKT